IRSRKRLPTFWRAPTLNCAGEQGASPMLSVELPVCPSSELLIVELQHCLCDRITRASPNRSRNAHASSCHSSRFLHDGAGTTTDCTTWRHARHRAHESDHTQLKTPRVHSPTRI